MSVHRFVINKDHFVDPRTGIHTQQMESTWSQLKYHVKTRGYLSIGPSRCNEGDKIQCHLMSYKSSQDIIHFNRSEYEEFKYNIYLILVTVIRKEN